MGRKAEALWRPRRAGLQEGLRLAIEAAEGGKAALPDAEVLLHLRGVGAGGDHGAVHDIGAAVVGQVAAAGDLAAVEDVDLRQVGAALGR